VAQAAGGDSTVANRVGALSNTVRRHPAMTGATAGA